MDFYPDFLLAMIVATVCAKERHAFPFDQATRITYIRLGNAKADTAAVSA